MKSYDKNVILLNKLRESQDTFTVSNDIDLTIKIKELLNKVDWDELWLNNIKKVNQNEMSDMSGVTYAIEKMAIEKDINSLLPSNTRFIFIKKVIRRIMRTVTRDQEQYNNSLFHVINEINKVNKFLYSQNIKLELQLEDKYNEIKRLEERIISLEEINDFKK